MTQMLLTIDNPKDANLIRKLLAKFEGVTISKSKAALDIDEYQPNVITLSAMQDLRSGKTYRASSAASLISDILGECIP